MPIPFPFTDPDAWDEGLELGGIPIPGLVKVGIRRANKNDAKEPKGQNGGSISYQGKRLAKVTIEITVTTQEEYTDLRAAWDLIEPQVDAGSGIPIKHPKAAWHRVRAVLIDDLEDPPNESNDMMIFRVSATEFAPPKKSAGFVTKTQSGLDPRKQILGDEIQNAPSKPSSGNTGP